MIKRVAHSIIIIEETKEFQVLDIDNYVLMTETYQQDTITVDEILTMTGVRFGLSTFIEE